MKYRVNKGKAFGGDGKEVPVGTVFEADEVPGFLVGKVELVPEDLAEIEDDAAKKAAEDDAAKKATEAAKTDKK